MLTRRLLNLLTALSLVLCVTVCVLWVRSYWVADELQWTRVDNVGRAHYRWYAFVTSGRGGLALCRDAEVSDVASITAREAALSTGVCQWRGWRRGPAYDYPGPAFSTRPLTSSFHFAWETSPATVLRELIVPYWAIALSAAAVPAIRLALRLRERRRRRPGFCPKCGYDLRATPGRCPECGTAASVIISA